MVLLENQPVEKATAARRVRGRGWMRVVAVLTPLLAVVVVAWGVEGWLRWRGERRETGFLRERGGVLEDDYRYSWTWFPAAMARAQQPVRVVREKGGVRRIVVYGESAAMGDPEPAVGLPRMLEVMLEGRYPGERWEVVNAAMTAINSWAVADIAGELSGLGADVSVVYMGNNEVVGPFGAGTVFGVQAPPGWVVPLVVGMRRSAIGQWWRGREEQEGASWGGMEMFLKHEVAEGSEGLARVRERFGVNAGRVAEVLRGSGPVVMAAAAVNLKDCAPFGGSEALAAWRAGREAGGVEAAAWYRRARDLDTLRFRCDGVMQAALPVAVAGKAGVRVVDVQAKLDAAGGGSAGAESFHEHVHLTPRGAWEVARMFAGEIAVVLGLAGGGEWPGEAECLKRLGFTPWHETRLLEEMRERFRRAPFTGQSGHAERVAALEARIAAGKRAATKEAMVGWVEEVVRVSEGHPEDWRVAVQAGVLLEAVGDERAMVLMGRAAEKMPHQSVLQQQGATLNRFRRYGEAVTVLRAALALRPEFPAAWNSLGIALAHVGSEEEAMGAFRRAIGQSPDYGEARRGLAALLMRAKREKEAEEQYRAVVAVNPEDVAAHYALGGMLTAAGRMGEAVPHYEAVARLLPGDAAAQVNAGALHVRGGRGAEALPFLRRALEIDPGNAAAERLLRELNKQP